ncbi:hypothetical protein C0Q70_17127 [Pomacea canaliculata]|uniref:Uncharacterized protein n=1 Tax=Pomacea canaliculata TaxID=400727 RepID=A0A2T7NRU0_POMCA|nr:hypothetical protein C0Q70_17127 [Pomacea canaliculata]
MTVAGDYGHRCDVTEVQATADDSFDPELTRETSECGCRERAQRKFFKCLYGTHPHPAMYKYPTTYMEIKELQAFLHPLTPARSD